MSAFIFSNTYITIMAWIPVGYTSRVVKFEQGIARDRGIFISAPHLTQETLVGAATQIAYSRDYGLPYMIIYDIMFDHDERSMWTKKERLDWARDHFLHCFGTHRILIWDYSCTLSDLYKYIANMCFHVSKFDLYLTS